MILPQIRPKLGKKEPIPGFVSSSPNLGLTCTTINGSIYMMALGRKLKQLRERAGLTQEDLSRQAGLPYTYVARIERGEIESPRIETRRKLAKVLRVSITQLLD